MNILIWTKTSAESNAKLITDTIEQIHLAKGDTVYKLIAEDITFNESGIKSCQEEISKAEMIYVTYSIEWGSYPFKFKESIDKILTYGFAYTYDGGSIKALLINKKAKIITTSGHPNDFYKEQIKAIHYLTKKTILEFVGIEEVGSINFGGRSHGKTEGFPIDELKSFIG